MVLRQLSLIALLAAPLSAAPPSGDARPPITGVSHLAVYSTDAAKTRDFYTRVLGARPGSDPENPAGVRYYFSARQFVEVLPAPVGHGPSMLAHVGYTTTDAERLRLWLSTHGVGEVSPVQRTPAGDRWFATHDPEGNEVQFVQPAGSDTAAVPGAISGRVIHVGYAVHDRAREDQFYRTVLGFRPYWFGAFDPSKVDWVSQQVPDGRDWMEYMMVGPTSDVTIDKVDAKELGVLNHLSLGVRNMEAAVTELYRGNRLSPRHDGPQMGLDGKWQANFYDPDGTRIELMEFGPASKPCCSPFTAASPTG